MDADTIYMVACYLIVSYAGAKTGEKFNSWRNVTSRFQLYLNRETAESGSLRITRLKTQERQVYYADIESIHNQFVSCAAF